MTSTWRRAQSGFTLTELIVTVAIVGLVAVVGNAMFVERQQSPTALASDALSGLASLQKSRRQVVTDGTVDAAVALGLPPDVRGTIDFEVRPCPNFNEPSQPPGCKENGGGSYAALVTKTLRASGVLEPVHETWFPGAGGRQTFPMFTWGIKDAFYADSMSLFDCATSKPSNKLTTVAACSSKSQGDVDGLCDGWTIVDVMNKVSIGSGANGIKHRTMCYANGTCDPVTYTATLRGLGGSNTRSDWQESYLGHNVVVSVNAFGSVSVAPVGHNACAAGTTPAS